MTTVSASIPTPKSYLTAQERDEWLRASDGNMDFVYSCESAAAGKAGDEDTAWAWLSLVALPAHRLRIIKEHHGPQFIRDLKMNTSKADAAFGAGWLDRA